MKARSPDYNQVYAEYDSRTKTQKLGMKKGWLRAKPGADRGENDPSQEVGKLNAAFRFKRNFF